MSVGIVLELRNSGQVTVNRGDQDNLILKEVDVLLSRHRTHLFNRGWTKLPKRGSTIGKTFIGPFKEAIENSVRDGNEGKVKKTQRSEDAENPHYSQPDEVWHTVNSAHIFPCSFCPP